MRRIGLVSCVKQKLPTEAPAQDLYTSPLFRKARAWAEKNFDSWFILSAKYGLLAPSAIVAPYDLTLNDMRQQARRDWAQSVFEQMRTRGLLTSDVEFVWLAGRNYKEHLSSLLKRFAQVDPMEGLRIGDRLHWLSVDTVMR